MSEVIFFFFFFEMVRGSPSRQVGLIPDLTKAFVHQQDSSIIISVTQTSADGLIQCPVQDNNKSLQNNDFVKLLKLYNTVKSTSTSRFDSDP